MVMDPSIVVGMTIATWDGMFMVPTRSKFVLRLSGDCNPKVADETDRPTLPPPHDSTVASH